MRMNRAVEDYLHKKMTRKKKINNMLMISRGEEKQSSNNGGSDEDGRRTVVVGLKLDSRSRELLTWALVKVAQPGDQVIALHVLNNNLDVVNGEGSSALLSLVKGFDSVLAVYEGFCNLKQVDLKLKICRGSCIRKVLVREAKACFASNVIVGTSRKHEGIALLSTSLARYCARKLPKDCWVLGVNNSKVIYQRQATGVPRLGSGLRGGGEDEHSRKSLLGSIRRSFNKNNKILNNSSNQRIFYQYPSRKSLQEYSGSSQTLQQQKCPICSSVSILLHSHCKEREQETLAERTGDNSLALVPVQTPEATKRSVSLLIQDLPDMRIGGSLLPHESPHNQQICKGSAKKEVSIFQWAMQLPSRYCSTAVHPYHQFNTRERKENRPSKLDGESGAIVIVGHESNPSASVDPESNEHPKEDCISSLDGESGAIVLVGRDSNHPASPDCETIICLKEDGTSSLDAESGAIVLVGHDSTPSVSPACELNNLPKELEVLHEKYLSTCRLFGYQELQSATSNFLPERLIGSGGSSHVYKGRLPDGKDIAVKILKPSEDIVQEFVLEIEIITTLNHKNIVSLFGFCFENNNLLLVYDFLSRGSLEENLHGNTKDKEATLNWGERYKVALGVAEALDYLHSGNAQSVIHRDVKSSNILLSDDYEPQLSDFGLATWASSLTSHVTCTDVAGTFGYLAPEYFMYGKLNDKVDVYAFGVVLLELLSGRKPISHGNPKGQESLVMWAKPILDGGKATELLDQSLGDNYDSDQMERMVLAATLCIRRSPRARPGMNLVMKLLQGDPEVTKWSKLQMSASEEFDGLDDEATASTNLQSHLNLALCDVEDESSFSSLEQNVSLEDYLQGRWSRTSSFD